MEKRVCACKCVCLRMNELPSFTRDQSLFTQVPWPLVCFYMSAYLELINFI